MGNSANSGIINDLGLGIPGSISNLFTKGDTKDAQGHDLTSFTNNPNTGGAGTQPYKVGDIAYEGLSANQDSITQFFRSFENAQAQSGQQKDASGQTVFNSGVAGLDKSQHDLQPAIDYFTKLLGGDRATVTSAAQPQVDQIGQQFDQVRNMLSSAPRGGGKASQQAQTPFTQIQQITSLLNQLRGSAATGLTATNAQEASTANSKGQLGLAQSQLGFQDLQSAIQSTESRKGYNVQESSADKSLAGQTISSLV